MIDLHAHILPGLDDGAKDMDEAIDMCFRAAKDGIDTIVATPHTGNSSFNSHRDLIFEAVTVLNTHLKKRKIPVKVLPGADNYINEHLVRSLQDGEAMTVNDNGRYVMVEFPRDIMPPKYLELVFGLKVKGITPIFTHPERNMAVQSNSEIVRQWVDKGGLVQITAMSLIGAFGDDARKCAEDFLRYRLVHVIASDAHSRDQRPPILSKAVELAGSLVGSDYARKLVEDFPAAIIAGRPFDVPEPIPKKLNFFARLLGK